MSIYLPACLSFCLFIHHNICLSGLVYLSVCLTCLFVCPSCYLKWLYERVFSSSVLGLSAVIIISQLRKKDTSYIVYGLFLLVSNDSLSENFRPFPIVRLSGHRWPIFLSVKYVMTHAMPYLFIYPSHSTYVPYKTCGKSSTSYICFD